jgi:hypothetical protein
MRFRPANIRLINRRHYLPRLLLPLSSFKRNDQRTLTGHYISGKYRPQSSPNSKIRTLSDVDERCRLWAPADNPTVDWTDHKGQP